jgi:hypothetical protein
VVAAAVHAQNVRGFVIDVYREHGILSMLQQPQSRIVRDAP